ncbi:MAG: hypothetical protein D6761_07745 [Candidatus Dadabacteria bacterium]|nr:MAG: hypothetical protein D6761_07745 [Candidatus Dadabacteria bacterium]
MYYGGPVRRTVIGTAAGALSASLAAGNLALSQAVPLDGLTYADLLKCLGLGAGVGIVFCLAVSALPKKFIARLALAAVAFGVLCRGLLYPAFGWEMTGMLGAATAVSAVLYGLLFAFIQQHAFDMALPNREMPRPATDYSDDPAGAHA